MVWQSEIPGSGNRYSVQGTFLSYDSTTGYLQYQATDFLGDPGANVGIEDACIKPTVVADGDNFVVGWTRVDESYPNRPYRIEFAYVEAGTSPGQHTVYSESSGVGFPLSDASGVRTFVAGASGETLGMDTKRKDPISGAPLNHQMVCVNIHSVFSHAGINPGEVLNEYVLYGWQVDFTSPSNPGFTALVDPSLQTPDVLLEDIFVDQLAGGYDGAGRVPPFVRETKGGHLIVSHDAMELEERITNSQNQDYGRVWVHSLRIAAGGSLSCVSSYNFEGPNLDRYQRRTNISADYDTNIERFSIGWLELDSTGANGGGNLGYFGLTLTGDFDLAQTGVYGTYTDPSDEVLDPRALYESTDSPHGPQTPWDILIGTNSIPQGAQDDFEIYMWDSATPTLLDTEFVPNPTSVQYAVTDPRRPALFYLDNFAMPVVYDAIVNSGGVEWPILHYKPR
ncbi:MAG: hypothetical protein DWQ01_22160 [Planctomycetota bacterium]|nr:MAG: hypothetical protein DWQ01_22160 [Planctomycetota bacterium]